MGENFPKITVCTIVTLLPNWIHLLPDCNNLKGTQSKEFNMLLDTKLCINTMHIVFDEGLH